MTNEELDALDAKALEALTLAGRASAGPWRQGFSWKHSLMIPYPEGIGGSHGERVILRMNEHFPHDADAQFIASARSDVPALADAVLALSAEVRRLRERDSHWQEATGVLGPDYCYSTIKAIMKTAEPTRGETVLEAVERMKLERDGLRARLATSPAGTVRLLYPDGSHRDVDPEGFLSMMGSDGKHVERRSIPMSRWTVWRREGAAVCLAEHDEPNGVECSAWATVRVETFEQEAARERAARIEAERQRDEARAAAEQEIACWLIELIKDVDAGQPGAREVVAELRRRSAEIRAGKYRAR